LLVLPSDADGYHHFKCLCRDLGRSRARVHASAFVDVGWPGTIVPGFSWLVWKKREMASNQGEAESRRIGRLVGLWSGAEGLAILLAAIILGNLGEFSLFTPVLSVIVGAHFFPLARGIPMRLYYLTGGLLMVLGTGATPDAVSAKAHGHNHLVTWRRTAKHIAPGR
jgi:hypothetical protein